MADFAQLEGLRSADELRARADEVQAELTEMNVRSEGRPFSEEEQQTFAALAEERAEAVRRAEELEARERIVASYSQREDKREALSFNTHRPGSSATKNIYDLSDVPFQPEARAEEMKDRAKRAIDKAKIAGDSQDHVAELIERDSTGELAQRILVTDSPAYKRAFQKYLVQKPLTNEEARALATSTNYAVPAFTDPTVVLTSAGVNNPIRQMARVITIVGNTWHGVASTGITASFSAESTEVGDNSPTLTQPAANVEKAQAFIQYPIEVGDDWGALEAEMARMFADARDTLESAQYLTGLGHGSNAPEGLLVGATGTVQTASSSVIAVADLYSLVEALSPRWRRRAQFAAGLAAYNKTRQLDTSGGANLWVQLGDGTPSRLLGYGNFEWSDYSSAITTGGSSVMTFGDFNEFSIIDRVGMNVEVVPHVFATANNRPSGNRGLYAYWRTTSDVRTSSAFKTLVIKS